MINLELTNLSSQVTLDINKNNNILIIDYKGYLEFYSYFYELLISKNKNYKIRLSNKNLDSKNTIFLDFTSVFNIYMSFSYKKGTLLYEYVMSKYGEIEEFTSNKLFELFEDVREKLSTKDNGLFFNITDDFDKLLQQTFEVSYDNRKIIEILKRLLSYYIKLNIGKSVIIFVNSKIIDVSFDDWDNVYIFDVAVLDDYKKYNLISYDFIRELDFNLIKDNVFSLYPLSIDNEIIGKYMFLYFKCVIYSKSILVYSNEEIIMYSLLNKCVGIKQKIIPINFIVNNDIKSFLATL